MRFMSVPPQYSVRLEPAPHPSERYYLFWMGIPAYDRYERLDVCHIPTKAIQNADYVFVRCSDEADPYMEFKILKNRSGRHFEMTQAFDWLKSQFPSIEFFHTLGGDHRDGIIRVSSDRDLLLLTMMHGADKCENRSRHMSR